MNQCLPALINYDTEVVGRVGAHIEELMETGIVDSVGSERLPELVLKSGIKIWTVSVIVKSGVKSSMMEPEVESSMMKSGVKPVMRKWLEPMMKAVMSTKVVTVKMTEVACGAYGWNYQNKS